MSKKPSSADGKRNSSLSLKYKDIEGAVPPSSSFLAGDCLVGETSRDIEQGGEVLVMQLGAVESFSPSKLVHGTEIVEVAIDET
jgi:hypothetical protein